MNMKKIISFFIVACCAMCATAAKVVWQIGVADNSGTEVALGPSEYKKFLALLTKMISLMCCQGLMILGEVHGVLPVGELMMQIYCLALKNCRNMANGNWW